MVDHFAEGVKAFQESRTLKSVEDAINRGGEKPRGTLPEGASQYRGE
jgi:hypothetical protein